jgi:hypothetical protein
MSFLSAPSFDARHIGYADVEVQKVRRIYDWMLAPQDERMKLQNQYNFAKHFEEHDKRRGTNFIKTFPELEEFYNFCKTIKL